MSDLHVSQTQQEMEENGEMDFIRSHVAAAADASDAPAPTGEDTAEGEETIEAAEETEAAEVETVDQEETEEDDTVYLDLDDETQALLDDKYGGDLNALLRAARESQSVIGRQGNEMGALRTELQQMREEMLQSIQSAQPYPEWPDEYAEANEAAASLRNIAEQAFQRRDPQTFQRAIQSWEDADPVSAGLYRDLKEMQVLQIQASEAPAPAEETLASVVDGVVSEFPQFQEESFQAEVSAELDKTPSLKAVLWGNVPGVSVEERATILRETAQRVVARTTSETAQQARKRIAVRTSEEARQARVSAQVERATSAREVAVEVDERKIPMGDTGRNFDINRLNAMLPAEDRV